MKVSAQDIQKLREKTGAGVMDCKQALDEAKGDFAQATEVLRKKGLQIAAKKSSRQTREGRVEAYVHSNSKIAVLVEVNCETDFVSRCDEFKHLAKDLAMQIAAQNPLYVKREDVPEKIVREHQADLEDFYRQTCLLEQGFIKDEARTIKDYLTETIAKIGENIVVRRFVRFQLGEE